MCEARVFPVLRIGVTDNSGELEIQDVANWELNDIRGSHDGTLTEHLAPFGQSHLACSFSIGFDIFRLNLVIKSLNSQACSDLQIHRRKTKPSRGKWK